MTHQDDPHAADTSQDQPTMELLDGAEASPPVVRSRFSRVARGALYGVLMLSATTLLAISAVPELASYVPFIPDDRAQDSCALSSGHCTTLDVAALKNTKGSPCCPLESAVAFEEEEGGCSKSCDHSESLASVSADAPSCCEKEVASSCCEDEKSCPLVASEQSTDTPDEQPLDEEALAKLPVGEDLTPLPEAVDAPETAEE